MSKNNTAVSNVIPFDFRGHNVRAIKIDGEPWFVASDVCRVLEVANTTQAVQALDDDERSMFNIGRQGGANIVNDSGLYTLILRSRDAVKKGSKAHAFRKWVTSEVLPAIRKHGSYEDTQGKMQPMVDELLGPQGARVLSSVIRCKTSGVPAQFQRSAMSKLSHALHARFSVPRMEDIPSSQMDAACNFIGAYALEGEFLGKEEAPDLMVNWPATRWLAESTPKVRDRMTMLQGAGNIMLTPDMLFGPVDCISPTLRAIAELEKQGHNLEACRLEVMAMKHHLEEAEYAFSGLRLWASRTQGKGIRFNMKRGAA